MKKITNLEIGTITFFIIRAYLISSCFNNLITISKQDSYVSIILGTLIGIIPLLSFLFIFNFKTNLSLFDKIKLLYGKSIGTIVNFIFTLFVFINSLVLFIDLITFIHDKYLNNTPVIFISLIFSLLIIYTLIKGINSILRASSFFFFLCLIPIFISLFGLLFKIDLNNFSPPLLHNYYKGSFILVSYNVLPLITLLQIPKKNIVNNHKTSKFIFTFYLIATFSILITVINVIGIFGYKLAAIYHYPEFQVLKFVYFKGLSSKLDSILFLQNLFDIIVFIIFSLFFCTSGLNLSNKKKNISYILILLIFMMANEKFSTYFPIKSLLPYISNIIFIVTTIILIISMLLLLFKNKESH